MTNFAKGLANFSFSIGSVFKDLKKYVDEL